MTPRAIILDIDGTLVDSNYQHVIGWQRAFSDSGFDIAAWRIHRCIGMGGDQIVTVLAGEDAERECGDAIRESEGGHYKSLMPEVKAFDGAPELIARLKEAGHVVVLASSAKQDEVEHYVGLLDAAERIDGFTSSADVDTTKPEPDLIEAALEKASTREAVMVGDSVWDVESASRAGIDSIAVLCGGFGEAELQGAGAKVVVTSIGDAFDEIQSSG